MKGKIILIALSILAVATIAGVAVYAGDNINKKISKEKIPEVLFENVEVKDKAKVKEAQALDLADQYKKLVVKEDKVKADKEKNTRSINLKKENVTEKGDEFWEVSDASSEIKIDSNTGKLKSILNKKTEYTSSKYTEKEVEKIAKELYKELNINNDYELSGIEMFSDDIWTAYFAKKVDGIYNNFQSIRMSFAPVEKEIVYLVIHDEDIDNTDVKISQGDAENIAKKAIKSNENIKCESHLQFVRANEFFNTINYSSYKMSSNIKKAWVVNIDDKYVVYVDCATGDVIGGAEYE